MTNHVLITGGAGFLGSHLVEHVMKTTDWTMVILDRLTYAGNLNRLKEIDVWEQEKGRVQFVYHDFRSPFAGKVLDMVLEKPIDYILHLGAETHVDNSIKDPMPFATSNVIGTVNMLDLANLANPKIFLYQSTDEVYGAVEFGELHREGEPHRPSNPYAASKSGAEAFCRAYHKSYGTPVLIVNAMNFFGERQDVEKFIPKTIRAIHRNEPVTIHCKTQNGTVQDVSSRCWLHARNQADGIMYLLEHGELGECYNVVGEMATVEDMAYKIGNIMGRKVQIRYEDFHSTRPGHDMHYGLDGAKLRGMGWVQPLNLDISLKKTVSWTLAHEGWI